MVVDVANESLAFSFRNGMDRVDMRIQESHLSKINERRRRTVWVRRVIEKIKQASKITVVLQTNRCNGIEWCLFKREDLLMNRGACVCELELRVGGAARKKKRRRPRVQMKRRHW